jgi:predicted RNase H-like HicB family nuclease
MNEQPTFTIILRWNEKQRAYTGQVQEVVGVEGSGSTYEEALASTLEALRWWREKSGEGSSCPFSQMLMREPAELDQEEPPQTG